MHTQSRNPAHERNHRISLMPMARPEGEPSILAAVLWGIAFLVAGGLAVVAFS